MMCAYCLSDVILAGLGGMLAQMLIVIGYGVFTEAGDPGRDA
jgi:hypothetical protein